MGSVVCFAASSRSLSSALYCQLQDPTTQKKEIVQVARKQFESYNTPLFVLALQSASVVMGFFATAIPIASLFPIGIGCAEGITLAAFMVMLTTGPLIAKINADHKAACLSEKNAMVALSKKPVLPITTSTTSHQDGMLLGAHIALFIAIGIYASQYLALAKPFIWGATMLSLPKVALPVLATAASTFFIARAITPFLQPHLSEKEIQDTLVSLDLELQTTLDCNKNADLDAVQFLTLQKDAVTKSLAILNGSF